ncbi:unnamed protein product [Nezara viridula]|uniref:Uncharacterized protein n=1 Tax=Nezara viridula TaxID=85310 RepID=A0A9P0HCM9_NEZVI|nr:unnamed protein product [Nezara viridula]
MPLYPSCCIHIHANPNVDTAPLRDNALKTTIRIEKAIADLWRIIGNEVAVTVGTRLHKGLHLDKRLIWNPYTRPKQQETAIRFRLRQHLLDKHSKLAINYKRFIYITILIHKPPFNLQKKRLIYTAIQRPVRTYGAVLRSSAKHIHINKILTA